MEGWAFRRLQPATAGRAADQALKLASFGNFNNWLEPAMLLRALYRFATRLASLAILCPPPAKPKAGIMRPRSCREEKHIGFRTHRRQHYQR
ncbi:MAG TPA: hypothetical protein VFK49_02915, partial [Stellaceae bacterium]|nr:hypothetical protein [Stellaceae bacterium]